MPCTIKCSVCNFKFFSDREDVTSPADILRRYSFKCPSCLKRLSFDYRKISINAASNTAIPRRNIVFSNRIRVTEIRKVTE
ncbi:MAG TPA: hypothetical protein VKU94_03790 [Geobacterales bacterium]|nr:hypothetical protein [Geobacterales bacterium]